ncbi:MAG TPA: CoA-binding protein [Flavobacterium sp.]|uniref:CoA-binding protein n=1 Tax=Flavobacterium sp. TaxID=239 RepID=UPI002C74EE62|nr:CoA-binding protein [Flavobacterium sp.]HSD13313.1 CoA-binding protein [Flavobacterium sp.]
MKTLVIGASVHPERYSFLAVNSLLEHGHEVVAIGGHKDTIGDVKIETEKLPFENVHTVTMYLNPTHQKEYYDYVISLKPQRVIFNPGAENEAFFDLLEKEHIPFESACTLVLLATNQF